MLEYKLKCITVIVDLETQAILILCLLSWIYTSAILAVVWNMNGHCVPRFVLQKLHELYKHLEWAPLRDNCVISLILYKCVAVYHQVIPELQQTGWCWLPLLPLVLATLPTCSGHCPSRITPYFSLAWELSKYPLLHVLLIFVKPASSLLDDSALCTWLCTRAFPTKTNPIRSKNIQMDGKAQSPVMKIVSVCTGMVLFPRKQAGCLNFLTTSSDVPAYACVYL